MLTSMKGEINSSTIMLCCAMLSRFSRVRLLATPRTAAYQAPLSMGFSRQEYWSGVPLSSPSTIIVGDFNTPLTPTDRSTKQKINKETQTLNDTIDQLDLIHIYRTFHPKTMNFTFFSSAHGTFSRIDHKLGHKSSLGKFKKLKLFQASFLITMR